MLVGVNDRLMGGNRWVSGQQSDKRHLTLAEVCKMGWREDRWEQAQRHPCCYKERGQSKRN